MGLFSAIGGLLGGPFGGAIGGIGDSILGNRSERKRVAAQNQLEMEKFIRLRKAAEDGGFHPLEALRAGGTVDAQAAPRLMSTLASSNAFDALENELTGEGARQRRREQVEDEIRERELERLKIETARGIIGPQGSLGGNGRPQIGADFDKRKTNTQETLKADTGAEVDVPVGPDIDEIVSGTVIDAISRGKAERTHRAKINAAPQRPQPIPQAIQQQMQAGRKSPGDTIRYKGKTWILGANGMMIDSAHETRPKGGRFSG